MAASNNFEFITRAKLCGHLLRRQERQKEAKKRPQDAKRAAVYVSLNYETGRPKNCWPTLRNTDKKTKSRIFINTLIIIDTQNYELWSTITITVKSKLLPSISQLLYLPLSLGLNFFNNIFKNIFKEKKNINQII